MPTTFYNANYSAYRKTMVDTQLRPNGVQEDPILKAFLSIPREKFLPADLQSLAYSDGILHVDKKNILIPPLFLALFLKALKVGELDSVLVIGDRTGYTSALFSMLAGGVVLLLSPTVSSQEQKRIQENLVMHALNPVIIKTGDLKKGFLNHAPYSYIFIDGGAVSSVPTSCKEQIEERGKIASFVGETPYFTKACLFQKVEKTFFPSVLFETGVPFLPEFQEPPSFSF